jgi:hypothetical protein
MAIGVLPLSSCGGTREVKTPAGRTPTPMASLPQVTRVTAVKAFAEDAGPFTASDGTVIHPRVSVPVSATPGGPPVAVLPSKQLGSPTRIPVVQSKPGHISLRSSRTAAHACSRTH